MNRRNESTRSSLNDTAKGVGKLMRDMESLVELQVELLRIECRDGLRRILIAVALLLSVGIVAAGTVPIVLILLAELLVQAAGLSRAAAFSIAAASGVLVTLAIGAVGWRCLHRVVCAFEHSREELHRNITWIKHALKRASPIKPKRSEQL